MNPDLCVAMGAAVQAARMGKKIILIEPGRHLGGMTSGGLGMTDNGSTETIGGLSRDLPSGWVEQCRKFC